MTKLSILVFNTVFIRLLKHNILTLEKLQKVYRKLCSPLPPQKKKKDKQWVKFMPQNMEDTKLLI